MADGISAQLVESELNIPFFAIGLLSGDRLACVVPDVWFNCLSSQRRVRALDGNVYKQLSSADARLLLSLSTGRLLSGWTRITLTVIKKCSEVVESLIEQPLCLGQCSGMSLSGIKALVAEERMRCLQQDAEEKYSSAIHLTCETDVYEPCLKEYNNFVREVLTRIYCCHLIPLDDGYSFVDEGSHIENDFQSTTHPAILKSFAVIESSKAFYVVHPFLMYTVSDLVTFSPSKLRDDTHNTKLFVLFELLKAVRHLHSCGISIYNMSLKDILIDDQLWLQIIPPPVEILYRSADVSNGFSVLAYSDSLLRTPSMLPLFEPSDLPSIVQQWVYRQISNFDYLMILNQLAGRSTNDPNHYPILPWVTDFASSPSIRRDLTKTKYRLNKGDEQLDLTFDVSNPESIMRGTGQTPFHVSDFLSDITYYVYNARRTPKDILCKFVRPRWVPNHYPVSLQRLYEWTPDECIPEFFTDPQIFVSIHDDLSDLEFPSWANSAEEFVRVHMEILESDDVSENLHHWIDLTFGYKLSGSAAISSKNICLQLVDRHKKLQNHGVVQLFSYPHPSRHHRTLSSSAGGEITKDLGARDAELLGSLSVHQPKPNAVNPLFALEHLESLYEFTMKTTNSLPPLRTSKKKDKQGRLQLLVARDMQTIGCLIVELFLPKAWILNQPANSLCKRYEQARRICQTNLNELPLCIRQGVTYLLNLNETWNPDLELKGSLGEVFRYPSVGLQGLPPPNIDILLHPSFCLLNFPVYFENLHTYLIKIKRLSIDTSSDSNEANGQVENQKVFLLTNLLTRISYRMGPDGLSLVIPHILELLRNHVSSVQCAWSLFYPVAQALGPSASAHHLLPPLVSLFDTEETTVKYLKIYHRSFINQLIVRLGLEVFLNTFSTLLIEAVSGYKNFDSGAEVGHSDGFVTDVASPVESKEDVQPIQLEFFSEDQTADVDKYLTDEVFDRDMIDRDGQKLYTDEEEDVISVESGNLVSYDIHSPAVDTERKTSLNLDNISIGSADNRDLVVVTGEEVMGDSDSRGGEVSSNDTDGGVCITVTPQKLNLTTYASLVGSDGSDYNVANVAAETIKWLAHRLGPVLTAKHISRNLLRMLALCYIGEEQLTAVDCHGIFPSTTDKYVVGDQQAALLLECLAFIATLYGEHVILLQYLQHVKELVPTLSKNFMAKSEGSLISCLVLLLYIIPYMSDVLLLDVLQETMFVGILQPLMDVVASNQLSFPSGSLARRLACYRLVDVLCIISLRIGFENTRQHMTLPIQKLFEGFSHVHDNKTLEENVASVEMTKNAATVPVSKKEGGAEPDVDANVLHEVRLNLNTNQFTVDVSSKHKRQSSLGSLKQHSLSPSVQNNGSEESSSNPEATNRDRIHQELCETFTPEMAHTAYIPICKLAGGIHVEQHLKNDDLIRSLCTLYDQSLVGQQRSGTLPSVAPASLTGTGSCGKSAAPTSADSVFGDSLIVEGNKIVIRKEAQMEVDQGHAKMSILSGGSESPTLRNSDMKADTRRHLRGNWLAYWEHEVGLNDRVRDFNLKQITLQSFQGHSSAIRDLLVLDNENSFISASKDRTVKLWSLRSYGDGSAKVGCQWTYTKHKKAVASVTFLDSIRLVASCDGNIHIWDPFMGMNVRQINAGRSFTVNVMSALPAPSSTILTASSDSILRFIDGRCGRFTHQFRTAIAPPGAIRSTAVSQDGRSVAVGFSTGLITVLDLRTGYSLATWKAHEAEIIEMKTFDSKRFVSSALDQMMTVWRQDDGKMMSSIKGLAEPVHRFSFYKDTVVAGSASNKVYAGSCIDSMAEFSCTKLKGDIFRGALSALTILPLNRLLMIGSDHGDIKLLA